MNGVPCLGRFWKTIIPMFKKGRVSLFILVSESVDYEGLGGLDTRDKREVVIQGGPTAGAVVGVDGGCQRVVAQGGADTRHFPLGRVPAPRTEVLERAPEARVARGARGRTGPHENRPQRADHRAPIPTLVRLGTEAAHRVSLAPNENSLPARSHFPFPLKPVTDVILW